MDCISGYKINFQNKPSQWTQSEPVFNPDEIKKLERSVGDLLGKGAIEECTPTEGQFLSRYFLVPKQDGSFRFVLNLKSLNEFIETDHFKLEDLRTAIRLVSKGSFMSNIDLQDAYFVIPVHKDSRKYLRFLFKGKTFEFTCLPFGLCVSPFVFTKVMKPVIGTLRSEGFLSCVYLDDILCLGDSAKKCSINTQATVELLEKLGFLINRQKSCLNPDTRRKFLGFVIDSKKMCVELTPDKKQRVLSMMQEFSVKKSCTIREFARFVGVLVACCPGLEYAQMHIKLFDIAKNRALIVRQGNFDKKLTLSQEFSSDFNWWISSLPKAARKIRDLVFDLEIYSDASTSGWGAVCNGSATHGFWNDAEKRLHINHLELLAVLYALKCFTSALNNKQILLRVDNTTALSYVNKMGGTHVPTLNRIARDIWLWCEKRELWIFASYIPSKDNVEADRESRVIKENTEWQLSDAAFTKIVDRFSEPQIDLFASRINKKCKVFCSWHRDPEAKYVDAFTISWSPWFFYAFPPFSLILKMLRKIMGDNATGVVVVPRWTAQPWYPLFNSLLVEEPIVLNPSPSLLSSPFRSEAHPLADTLTLVVGKLSGRRSKEEEPHLHRSRY